MFRKLSAIVSPGSFASHIGLLVGRGLGVVADGTPPAHRAAGRDAAVPRHGIAFRYYARLSRACCA